MVSFEVFEALLVKLHVNLLVQMAQLLCNLVHDSSLSTAFLHVLQVNFLVKLLLDVERVSLAVHHFECVHLRSAYLLLHHLFEIVKLAHNVILALVEGILNFFKVYFAIELPGQVLLGLHQLIVIGPVCHIAPNQVNLFTDLVCLPLLVRLALGHQLVNELGSLFHVALSLIL